METFFHLSNNAFQIPCYRPFNADILSGDSTAILFSSPVFVMLFSVCILREKCRLLKVVCACLLVAGILLVARPPGLFGSSSMEDYDALGTQVTPLCTVFFIENMYPIH